MSARTLEDVADMVRDGVDLRGFRKQLATFAARVPPEPPKGNRRRTQ